MATPRPFLRAASVILCRGGDEPRIFWVRRQPALPFLGGFHSFPGGRVSKDDRLERFGMTSALPDADLRLAAIRELHEETGVLLARESGGGVAPRGRLESVPRGGDFAAALREHGLVPDLEALVPAGRWITPPFGPARFDTSFYLAWGPEEGDPVVESGELAEGAWIRPEAALDAWSENRALLAAPTLYALRGLSAAAFEVEGGLGPLTLEGTAEHLTDTPEADGGDVQRVEIRPDLFTFPMRTRTLPPATHTNAYLVGHGAMILIDPGSAEPDETGRLLHFIEILGGEGRSVAEIWLTHHHPDHTGGAAAVATRLGVPVRAHPETAALLGALGVPVEPTLVDGFVRELRGTPGQRLRVHHTPGHAPGHITIHEEIGGSLFTGDMVSGIGFILIDPPAGRMAEYMASLERLKELMSATPGALFPGHGPATGGAVQRLSETLAHRREREAKVLAALEGGGATVAELLPRVYDDVEAALLPLAARSLLAHLIKLTEEGRVKRSDDRYEWVTR